MFLLLLLFGDRLWMNICTVGFSHFLCVVKCCDFHVFFSRADMQIIFGTRVVKNARENENNTDPTCKFATWPVHVFEASDNRKGWDANDEGKILQAAVVVCFKTNASFYCGRMAGTKAWFNINPTNRPLKPHFTTLTRDAMAGLMMTLLPAK